MAKQLTLVASAETAPEVSECPNCGEQLLGEFCHGCGQKKLHRRELSLKHFFVRATSEFTDLESNKAVRTFKALLFKPGQLTNEFLSGRKGQYITPIRLYLTFSALYFLFAWGALSEARGGGVNWMSKAPWAIAMAKSRNVDVQTLVEKISQRAEKYATVLRFASVLVSGVFLTLLYYGTRRYYVEHLVFSLHYYSFDFLTKSVFGLLFVLGNLIGTKLPAPALNLFYPLAFIYLLFALRRVFQQSWGKTLMKSVVLFLCETVLFMAVNMIGFMVAIFSA
ncbi:MAG TPA: DUF3667 domain-containing protein [Pyrinomonadaceae bacterium]|nr:DUF3667 domain-containing protein [Pyrinomonadaceae bacterium]